MKATCVLPFLLLFASLGCERESQLAQAERQQLAEEATHVLNEYLAAVRRDGLMAEFKYLDKSADFCWAPPGYSVAISFDSVAAILKMNAPRYKSVNNTWDTLRVTVLKKDLASYTGRLHSIVTDTAGNVFDARLIESGILIRRIDGWKLLAGQTSAL